jgi:hypothetical protein
MVKSGDRSKGPSLGGFRLRLALVNGDDNGLLVALGALSALHKGFVEKGFAAKGNPTSNATHGAWRVGVRHGLEIPLRCNHRLFLGVF